MISHKHHLSLLLFIVVGLSACSSVPVERPIAEMALANSALNMAENSGADEYAPIELRIAKQKLKAANQAMASKDFDKARMLVVEARVDAELAKAVAEKERARLQLWKAQDGIKVIRQQISENVEE